MHDIETLALRTGHNSHAHAPVQFLQGFGHTWQHPRPVAQHVRIQEIAFAFQRRDLFFFPPLFDGEVKCAATLSHRQIEELWQAQWNAD
jgi:hypothetical protein